MELTHFDDRGNARMVDVGEKAPSRRTATAAARVLVNGDTFALIRAGGVKKGDVLTVAQLAAIMGAKRTPDLIPLCHPIPLEKIEARLRLDEARCSVEIETTVATDGKTGVEMEALTGAAAAALTVYDMCKAVQRDMVITDLRLLAKSGGVHGDYRREERA
ncbi:MAG: cyclic pyranopterin monophosphate synthase MoaC [Oscillospiraceae bacterium]|nr:cyclic pyranopterin monophosphate synthase MoaC [Oscillospiraceae bacterium]